MRIVGLFLTLLVTVPLAAAPVCSSITTTAPPTYPAGAASLYAVDADRDGHVDVIAAGLFDTKILYGRGNGTFEQPRMLAVMNSPVFVGDFNGDGHPDVAGTVGRYGEFKMLVMLNQGGREFDVSLLADLRLLGAADFTNDGRSDLLVRNGRNVEVMSFGGSEGFTVVSSMPRQFLYHVEIGDLDGDENADLVTEDEREMRLFRGTGKGSFHEPVWLGPPGDAIVAEVTRDGRADLLLFHDRVVTIYPGPVRGAFASNAKKVLLGTNPAPAGVAAADFNGDGTNDLAIADKYDARVTIYLNDGHGNFAYRSELRATDKGVAAADFNRDGVLDLVAGAHSATLFLGKGKGTFRAARTVPSSSPQWDGLALSADIDLDGIDELFLAGGDVHIGRLALGHTYLFERLPIQIGSSTFIGARELTAAEIDNQPGLELVVGNGDRLMILTLRDRQWKIAANREVPARIRSVAVSARRVVFIAADGMIRVLEADQTIREIANVDVNPWVDLTAADFDGDRIEDLIILGAGDPLLIDFPFNLGPPTARDGEILLMRGRADGTFAPPETIFSGFGMTDVAAGDFNADGWNDLAVSTVDGGIHVVTNEGGAFASLKIDDWNNAQLVVRDVDLDGVDDLVAGADGVALFRGSLAGPRRVGAWTADKHMVVARMRRDAPPSLLSGDDYTSELRAVDFECGPRRRVVRH